MGRIVRTVGCPSRATAFSTHFLRDLSTFGGTLFLVSAAVAIAVYELIKERRWAPIGFLILCVGGQFLMSNLIKAGVQRERPDVLRPHRVRRQLLPLRPRDPVRRRASRRSRSS